MISIVTGTYNRKTLLPGLIANTIDSSDKLELVLVDGGSTDGSVEYLKDLNHPQIKLIEVGHRSSYPHFMNLGIKSATFDFICQWNDDVLLINSWDEVIEGIEDCADFYLFNWKSGKLSDLHKKDWLKHEVTSWQTGPPSPKRNGWNLCYKKKSPGWLSEGRICMNYGIYRKEIFKEIGLYDSKFKYYYADSDMAERAWHFEYKVKVLRKLKVLAIKTSKRAIHHSADQKKYASNLTQYKNKIIPNTVEFLEKNNEKKRLELK